jgi:hypothetical protein
MLRWKPRQRAELVTLLREAASLGLAGLVFGQAVGNRPFSWPLVMIGLAIWVAFASATMWLAGVDETMMNALALYGGVALIGLVMTAMDWYGRRLARRSRKASAEARKAG